MCTLFVSHAQTQASRFTVTGKNSRSIDVAPSFTVQVVPGNDGQFILQVSNPQKKKLDLWIQHSVLGTVLEKRVYDDWFSCRYNMENADDGKYIITLSCGKERITKALELTTTTTVVRNMVVQ